MVLPGQKVVSDTVGLRVPLASEAVPNRVDQTPDIARSLLPWTPTFSDVRMLKRSISWIWVIRWGHESLGL